ncbi:hypothetical protein SEPCBS119000_006555 [Sporothrix epigloea]|uniref:Uncharacterized protein n=1 Tax=Sporothrix epigloea TaxID=1892477 RepID=A0ABP0E3J0_9PEZI
MERFMTSRDMYHDPTHGLVVRCQMHDRILDCFLLEMDRVIVQDQLRFQHSMRIFNDDIEPRLNIPLLMIDDTGARPEFMTGMHDPRVELICKDFIARRWSIPLTLDAEELPVLPPPDEEFATLDTLEGVRIAINERDRLYRLAERTKRRARHAHLLVTSTMAYTQALKDMFPFSPDGERDNLDCGIILAIEMERECGHLATEVIENYYTDLEHFNDMTLSLTDRIKACLDVLRRYEEIANPNMITRAAITSHTRLFRAALVWAGAQARRPLEPFDIDPVPEPSPEDTATWTYASTKSAAVRAFIVADKALDAVKEDQISVGDPVNLEFDVYPQRNFETNEVSIIVDQEAYDEALNNLIFRYENPDSTSDSDPEL